VFKSTRADVQVCRNLLRHEYADRQSNLLLRENETLYGSKQKQAPIKSGIRKEHLQTSTLGLKAYKKLEEYVTQSAYWVKRSVREGPSAKRTERARCS
jgi:hypothetical protein